MPTYTYIYIHINVHALIYLYTYQYTYKGGLIGETGLPFHIEGPFLQNIGVRHLPLPVSSDSVFGGIGIGQDGGKNMIDLSPYLQAMSQRMGRKVIIYMYTYKYTGLYINPSLNLRTYSYIYATIYMTGYPPIPPIECPRGSSMEWILAMLCIGVLVP
jgi:hypothetical protein